MNLEVNVTDVDLSAVVREDTEYGPAVKLGDLVIAELVQRYMRTEDWPTLRKRVTEIRDEEIRAQVTPMITEAVARPVQKTNTYGEPIGEATSLREVVIDEARKILQGTKGDSYNRKEGLGRQLIREMVEKELRTELTEVIKEERQKVVNAVRAQAAELITEAVTKGVTGR